MIDTTLGPPYILIKRQEPPRWGWDPRAKRYRNRDNGQFMARETVLGFVDRSLDTSSNYTRDLAELVDVRQISPSDWHARMRQEIKDEYIRQYLLGTGGRDQMRPADWGSVGGMIGDQYRYLRDFYAEIESGDLTEAQIRARAAMYINSAREAYERANARAQSGGTLVLPAYPGDGSTICLTNCRCFWDIQEILDDLGILIGWNAYWTLTPAEHCTTCLGRAGMWNPYTVEIGPAEEVSA